MSSTLPVRMSLIKLLGMVISTSHIFFSISLALCVPGRKSDGFSIFMGTFMRVFLYFTSQSNGNNLRAPRGSGMSFSGHMNMQDTLYLPMSGPDTSSPICQLRKAYKSSSSRTRSKSNKVSRLPSLM